MRLRTRYYDHEAEVAKTEALQRAGLIEGTPLSPVGALRDVIDLTYAARAAEAESLWGHMSAEASRVATQLGSDLTAVDPAIHPLAFAHQALPTQPSPCDALLQRLVTLRYIRMDDHARAWTEAGKTADEMVEIAAVAEKGRLSESESRERALIEETTNRYNAASLAAILDVGGLLAELRDLPTD